MSWTALLVISLCACLIWELDARQTIKKHKKKKRLKQIEKQEKK